MHAIRCWPRVAAALAVLAAAAAARSAGAQVPVQIPSLYPGWQAQEEPDTAPRDTTGLRFRLVEGSGRAAGAAPAGVETAGRRLSAAATSALLARLPALWRDTATVDAFAFAGSRVPPPRTRFTVDAAFPPRDTVAPPPASPGAVPLRVIRHAPEGEIPLGAGVTIVFNQPMVPLASLAVVDGVASPASITPAVAGRWRWLDPATLRFEPEGRLPMATRFTVRVPAGTRAASGAVLGADDRFTFTTAPVAATGAWPTGRRERPDPVLVLTFDQDVDPAAMLPFVRLRAGGRVLPLRLATPAELRADTSAAAIVRQAKAGRWMALRPTASLPLATDLTGVVLKGAPSREGPVTTDAEQTWSFRTYGPLELAQVRCGWRGCEPGWGWSLTFTNELDSASWSPRLVRVQPALEGLSVTRSGASVLVAGRSLPHTVYHVTVSGALRDVYGQRLGKPATRTVEVGEAGASLESPYGGYVVIDPAGPPTIFVRSRGHEALLVHLRRLSAADLAGGAMPGGAGWWDRAQPPRFAGEEVWSGTVRPEQEPGVLSRVPIDLSPALRDGLGQLLVVVEPAKPYKPAAAGGGERGLQLWVQVTRMGLAAMTDGDSLLAWATSLVDGRPVRGATVEMVQGGLWTSPTDSLGLARPGLAPRSLPHVPRVLVARSGADVAVLPDDRWERGYRDTRTLAYVWTDRDLYRPGERMHLKGWMRVWEHGATGALRMPAAGDRVEVEITDREGETVRADTLPLSPLAGFDEEVAIPATARVGRMEITVRLLHGDDALDAAVATVNVQEYRRPEFSVALEPPAGPVVVGEGGAQVGVRVAYYSGGGLSGAAVRWTATARAADFTPPGRGDWTFGPAPRWSWWWWWWSDDAAEANGEPRTLDGTTDARGTHSVGLVPERAVPAVAHTVHLAANVQDATRQTWSESADVLVHPARAYVGLRTSRRWVMPGDTVTVEALAVGLDGAAKPGLPIRIRAVRTRWLDAGEQTDTLPERCDLVSGEGPVQCRVVAPPDGWLKVTATVRDERERASLSEANVWVGGGWFHPRPGPAAAATREALVVADRDAYEPGDTARVLVTLPFYPARGLVTLRHGGLVRSEAFTADDGPTHVVRIPITGADIPNLHVRVDAVGAPGSPADTVAGTASAAGSVELKVSRAGRALAVRAVPRDTLLAPGGGTPVALRVSDAEGRPVANAEVALAVVDESLLALTGYRLSDPLLLFYPERPEGVEDAALRPRVVLAPRRGPAGTGVLRGLVTTVDGVPAGSVVVAVDDDEVMRAQTDANGEFSIPGVPFGPHTVTASRIGLARVQLNVDLGAATRPLRFVLHAEALALEALVVTGTAMERASYVAADSIAPPPAPPPPPAVASTGGNAPIRVRSNFNPLAAFVARVRTDAAGQALVPVTLPDNLTRYRVMVAAVADSTRYGLGESEVTAAQTLMARPSPPRFLTLGDRFELPVVIQNRGALARVARVAVRGAGVSFADAGREVTVPGGGRVQVSFAGVADRAGQARIQVAVEGGAQADAQELSLPVLTPATAQAFATYGTVDSGAVALPLALGADVVRGFGGLDVTLSSTAMQELSDGVIYLRQYPWDCSEQISSRMLGLVGLRDVLTAFRAPGLPDSAALARSMAGDVAQLAARQRNDGSFGLWGRDEEPRWPFLSVHVTHALLRAREKGYEVPDDAMDRALEYLEELDAEPGPGSEEVQRSVRVYAAYVLNRARPGSASEAAARLARETSLARMPLDEAGWLLSALAPDRRYAGLADSLRNEVESRAVETEGRATFAAGTEENDWYLTLPSASRTDGVVLEALMAADPGSDLVVKTARQLLARRVRGAWRTTHDNGWALLALDAYFRRYEKEVPAFAAGAWLGPRYAGGRRFDGRTTDELRITVPMAVLAADTARTLTLGKTGPGRMYYRAGLRWATASPALAPQERGFVVRRAYAGVDDSADVRRGPDGAWHVRAGSRVRVTLTLTVPADRYHVVLSDPLPAGLEPVNPELRGRQEGADPAAARRYVDFEYWSWPWYQHQELRDDRAAAFAFSLGAGMYTYAYVARATTPGTFTAPPARAEEMYSPEVFGSGTSDRVIVER